MSFLADLIQQQLAVALRDWLSKKMGWTKRMPVAAASVNTRRQKRAKKAKR